MGKSLMLVFSCVAFCFIGCIEQVPNGARIAGDGLVAEGEGQPSCTDCANGVCRIVDNVPTCIPSHGEGEGEGNTDGGIPDADTGPIPDVGPDALEGEGEGPIVGEGEGVVDHPDTGPDGGDAEPADAGDAGSDVPIGSDTGEGEGQPQLAQYGESCLIGADCGSGICLQVGQNSRCTQACGDCPTIEAIEMVCTDDLCIPRGATCEGLNVGASCSNGVGVCRRDGQLVCNESGDGVSCNAMPGSHGLELCGNALDDDCDGEADEGFPQVGQPCEVNVLECVSHGRSICSEDRMGLVCNAPAITPEPESCNNEDDDCDGDTDEDFSLGEACVVGLGICRREGEFECGAEQDEVCSVGPGSPEQFESCNNEDDDCDGDTDEEVDLDRDTFLDVACGGDDCDDSVAGVNPNTTEDCDNNEDDDCDGQTDASDLEDCGPCQPGERRRCGQTDVGLCEFGEQLCSAEFQWGQCDGAIAPVVESCDGFDNDCDNDTDEVWPELDEECTGGVGICEREGHIICTGDGADMECDAISGNPAIELCGNAVDDDCDDETDEGFDVGTDCLSGQGICERSGQKICSDDQTTTACDAVPGDSQVELCNALDDDCDGVINNDNPGGGADCDAGDGICEDGVTDCSQGQIVCQRLEDPRPETCNALDDDCNGVADNGFALEEACNVGIGACERTGQTVCNAGGDDVVCNAQAGNPSNELCGDAVDNDCNSNTDEGFDVGAACVVGVGACARNGQKVCTADRTTTECDAVAGNPVAELCGNAVDDDCNGQTDEGFPTVGQACSAGVGECHQNGNIICDGAGTRCNAVAGNPVVERCDGLDNDCNTVADNGFALGQACTNGVGGCQRAGQTVCNQAGDGTTCNAVAGNPGNELCGNAVDDDCDTQTDEGFDVGAACSVGVGVCVRSGNKVCTADRTTTECNVQAGAPVAETCNNLDDDCNGIVDNGLTEVYINSQGGYCIDLYEASIVNNVAQSASGVMPASSTSWNTANAACIAAGKRLCTKAEWCVAGGADANCAGRTYPWGAAALDCNRSNYVDCGEALKNTGNHPTGVSPSGVHDLVGNVWEWLSDASGGNRLIKGGGYQTSAGGQLQLTHNGIFLSPSSNEMAYGFRCCH